jgi:hypothetical protein
MKALFLDKGIKTNAFTMAVFVLCYYATFPQVFLVSDEWGYVGRAWAILNGSKSLFFTDLSTHYKQNLLEGLYYPLGTSYLAAIVMAIGGKKMCFLVGLLSLLISQLLMVKMVHKLCDNSVVALLTWCCLPCLVMSRTVMSDTPALLVSSLFFYFYFKELKSEKSYFLLGFLGGISVLFRENLIILFAFYLGYLFYTCSHLNRFYLFLGGLLGLSIRLFSAYYFYEDPFYYRLTTPFNGQSFFYNIFFYVSSLTIIFPLASFTIFSFKGKNAVLLKFTIFAYILFFSLYSYNGSNSGFIRSIILSNRFFMPLLPLIMVTYAQYWQKINPISQRKIHQGLFIMAFVMVISTQITAHYYEEKNKGITNCTKNSPILIASANIFTAKYINVLTTDSPLISLEACKNNPQIVKNIIEEYGYCHLFQLDRPTNKNYSIVEFKKSFVHQEICSFTTPDGYTGRLIQLK